MQRRRFLPHRSLKLLPRTVLIGTVMITTAAVGAPVLAIADPPPSPTPAVSPAPTLSPTPAPITAGPTGSSTPSPSASTPAPSGSASPTPSSSSTASGTASPKPAVTRPQVQVPRTTAPSISLAVSSVGSPVAGQYFQDIGSFGFAGTISPVRNDQQVEIWHLRSDGSWRRSLVTSTDSSGHYRTSKPVTASGVRHFAATLGGNPASSLTVRSSTVSVTVHDAKVNLTTPAATIDALKKPVIHGTVYPAMSGVRVHFQVRRANGSWHDTATMTTRSDGKFHFTFGTGTGLLRSYYVRARRWDHRGGAWETSHAAPIKRIKVLHAVVTQTTAADVADTYHAGCPVGRKKLRTIHLNYYGLDKRMHRGVIIVAAGRVKSVKGAFRAGLRGGFRIRQMTNPNHWGGSDPKQMEADNSSGFNCRKVTGNPYAQSPHSYGIAIDVNTRENPYRDVTGKWWPESGTSYIKRTPWRQGMLTANGHLTKGFRNRGYFWGGFWSPGKDYQHFEYDQ